MNHPYAEGNYNMNPTKNNMKKVILLTVMLGALLFTAHAQRFYGQWTMSVQGGYGNHGYTVGISGEKYLGHTLSAVKAGIFFSQVRKSFQEWQIPINRYAFNASYFYSLERYMSEKVFVNIGGGIFVGAEEFRKIDLPYGVIQTEGTIFIAGILINPQVEFLFKQGSNLTSFIKPQISYDFFTRLDRFCYNLQIGIKYYF